MYLLSSKNELHTTYGFVQIKQHLSKIELQFAKVCLTDQISCAKQKLAGLKTVGLVGL